MIMPDSQIKYAIASGHAVTTEVAETILSSGGNAFDAAVAAYLASFVSEPVMASAGAGGFANVYTKEGDNFILDFFCQTPANNKLEDPRYDPVDVDFGESIERFFTGPSSMAVPGSMALIQYLSKHYCSIPLQELVKPAQKLGNEGLVFTSFQAEDTSLLANILLQNERGKSLFLSQDKLLQVGDNFSLPHYADFLESFAREKPNWFYVGELAQTVSKYVQDNNGYLDYEDFINYQIEKRRPYLFDFQGCKISVPALPSLGGALMHIFLQNFSDLNFKKLSSTHYTNLRKAFAEAIPYTSNPEKIFTKLKEINPAQADAFFSGRVPGGTSHINIVDKFGNAIALSTSIGVGSGYFIPGTDMQMNNMLGEPGLMQDGLGSWKPNTRLNSMMSPCLCFDRDKRLILATGTGGSMRIPFSLGQILLNKFGLGLSIEEAIQLPRMYENENRIYLEHGFDHHSEDKDKELREWPGLNLMFGGTHTIDLQEMKAVGDDRREGAGVFV